VYIIKCFVDNKDFVMLKCFR